jgi:hypothetical protein
MGFNNLWTEKLKANPMITAKIWNSMILMIRQKYPIGLEHWKNSVLV